MAVLQLTTLFSSPSYPKPQFRNYKIVYRRYAGLFFCVCVDANDNELAYLEAIHLFVEVLGKHYHYFILGKDELNLWQHLTDTFFDNVCELDLVFNFYKVIIHS
jgi:AP-2 complex subunit sigma-1